MTRRPRVGWVTGSDPFIAAEDTDRPPVVGALDALGVEVEVVSWRDPSVTWERLDVALLRSPWDYPEHVPELRRWLDRVEPLTEVLNPPSLVRWNLDKRYLADLAAAGVAVVPTAYAPTVDEIPAALAAAAAPPWGAADEVVVKPTVSAGSRSTGRFRVGDPEAAALVGRIVAEGGEAMVQPAVPSVAARGERALVLVDGELSHACSKGPILALGGGFVGGSYRESVARVEPAAAERAVAEATLAALPGAPAAPLYARVDVVDLPDGTVALLEAELFEPTLFLHLAPQGAAPRFAAAVARRAQRAVESENDSR